MIDALFTLQRMLSDERRDLLGVSGSLPPETLERMLRRMKEAENMVMDLQGSCVQSKSPSTSISSSSSADVAGTPSAGRPKRKRGGQAGSFLAEGADRGAYLERLRTIFNHCFQDATHMRLPDQKVLSATHFFACLFVIESMCDNVTESPTVKSFHQLLLEAASLCGLASRFTLSQGALSDAVKEYRDMMNGMFPNKKAIHWSTKERQQHLAAWEREMQLVSAALASIL